MELYIIMGIPVFILSLRIANIVRFNMKITKGIENPNRRALLWRYGPFKIDDHVIEKYLQYQNQEVEGPETLANKGKE
jgi:hypothetical protein